MARQIADIPLVFSCSGCSSAAQTTNTLALLLDRDGEAQMSCIAGVGGDIPKFVREVTSGRPILGLDGCPLTRVHNTLKRHGVEPDRYVQLQSHGIKKRYGQDAEAEDVERLYPKIVELARELRSDTLSPQGDDPEAVHDNQLRNSSLEDQKLSVRGIR